MYQQMQFVISGPVHPALADGPALGELLRTVAGDVELGLQGGLVALPSQDGFAPSYQWGRRRYDQRESLLATYGSANAALLPPGLYFALFHGRDRVDQCMDEWGFDGPMLNVLAYHVSYNSTIRLRFRDLAEAAHFGKQCGTHCPVVDEWMDVVMVDGLIQYGGKFYGDWTVFLHLPDGAPDAVN